MGGNNSEDQGVIFETSADKFQGLFRKWQRSHNASLAILWDANGIEDAGWKVSQFPCSLGPTASPAASWHAQQVTALWFSSWPGMGVDGFKTSAWQFSVAQEASVEWALWHCVQV